MDKITKSEAIEALKKVFDYEAHKENKEVMVDEKENGDATFMVNKMYIERFGVIDKLQDFFKDRYIEDGQCRIESITLLYTIFFIENRKQ